jgi:TIR domain/Tetratricopeptide repeat
LSAYPSREQSGAKASISDSSVEGHDVFVSHAGEVKDVVARPLATALRKRGYRVWFDEFELRVGMSLRRSIDKGLAGSRFGIVILSPAFFGKEWPERELDGLAARETTDGRHLILPVWHNVDRQDVAAYSPVLADRIAARTNDGLDEVVTAIIEAIGPPNRTGESPMSAGELSDVRLSPMPETVELSPVLLGSQLLRLIGGTIEAVFELDRLPRGPTSRRTAELFDDLRDRGDMLGELGMAERDRWEDELSGTIRGLLDERVVLLGGTYVRHLVSPGRTEPWPGFVIRAVPLEDAQRLSQSRPRPMSNEHATAIALAQVLIDKGDWEGAEARLRPIAEHGNGHAMLLLGMVLRDQGKNREAAAMLQRAADAGRDEALTPLGMVLRDLGQLDEAEEVLTRALGRQGQAS